MARSRPLNRERGALENLRIRPKIEHWTSVYHESIARNMGWVSIPSREPTGCVACLDYRERTRTRKERSMSKRWKVRTPDELQSESRIIRYEFVQLCGSSDRLRRGVFLGDRVTLNNTVQGFVTACRNLSCFFFPHTTHFPDLKRDDLGAEEYVPDWRTRCPAPSLLLQDAKTAANTQVMHMTGERRDLNLVPGKEYNWPIDRIECELLGVLRVFLAAAPVSLFDPSARADLQRLAAPPVVASSSGITHTGYTSTSGLSGVTGGAAPPQPVTSGCCAKTCPD
jgi:hypothetical protein